MNLNNRGMFRMTVDKIKYLYLLISILAITGCSHGHVFQNDHNSHRSHEHKPESHSSLVNWQIPANTYRPKYTHKLLSDYTEKLAMELIENMQYVSQSSPIAVTSFVDLDNNLKTTNILGNQLAEDFIHELQVYGLTVVDYKHTGQIAVSKNGDFVFSRDGHELGNYPEVKYVLSGTLTYNNRGAIINARIIGVDSKVVVSSAKSFIPSFIIESLHSKTRMYQDGIIRIKN